MVIALVCTYVMGSSGSLWAALDVRKRHNKNRREIVAHKEKQEEEMVALPIAVAPEDGAALPSEASQPVSFDGASDDVWAKVLAGYRNFKRIYPKDSPLMKELAKTQKPQIMVVACADSRVDPAVLLQAQPGDMFILRNIANIVPTYSGNKSQGAAGKSAQACACPHGVGAALEYGIEDRFLDVKHLILFGHSKCGGIKGLMTGIPNDIFITEWVSQVKGALPADYKQKKDVTDQEVNTCARAALKVSYEHAMQFPFIAKKVADKKLVVHAWFFDLEQAKIFMYAKDKAEWEPLNEEALTAFLKSKGYGDR